MIKVHSNFTGGNISVKEQNGDKFLLENELRGSVSDWFYWAFCVEGAEGKELTFSFDKRRVGYFGPAVSYDLREWRWLDSCDGDSFKYKFDENESKVYFAHSMLYHPDRFISFAEEKGIEIKELCKSKKGRSVPCFTLGNGETSVILTSRHHACESTGNFVLEGVIDELVRNPIENATVFCVPFVDYDGVVDGDQGKFRGPYDHNRDYGVGSAPIYPETRSIRKYANGHGCNYGFDFHSPGHFGRVNDNLFLVRNDIAGNDRFDMLGEEIEKNLTDKAMKYSKENDFPANTDWNTGTAHFSYNMVSRTECNIACTLETTYFGTEENKVSDEKLVEFGRCFARAVKGYILKTR